MSEEAKKRLVVLPEQRMQSSEYARRDWVVNAEAGTTIDDVLNPAFWAYTSLHLSPYDHIEVRLETGEWVLELMVISCERNYARVFLMQKHDLEESTGPSIAPPSQKHKVEWKGPQLKFCVIRIADSELLQSGLKKEEAYGWMQNYEKVTA